MASGSGNYGLWAECMKMRGADYGRGIEGSEEWLLQAKGLEEEDKKRERKRMIKKGRCYNHR